MEPHQILSVCTALALAFPVFAKEAILVVEAHPDDSIAMAGTLHLMAGKYDLHLATLTKGQRGCGVAGFKDGSTAAKRTIEEENAAKLVGAKVHWMGFMDGELYATPEACKSIADLIAELKPRAIFSMWPIDRHQDHSMAGTITLKAARLAGFKGEFYYYEEVWGSKGFVPMYFVNVSSVIEQKQKYTRCHVCQNGNDNMNIVEMHGARSRGYQSFYDASRSYAECFSPLAGFQVQGARCIFTELPLALDGADAK